jgi:[citrate (pro-3S)-lyase] ligase
MTESEQMLIEELKTTTEFCTYLGILKELSKTMAVAVVSADTPIGTGLTQKDVDALHDLGFRTHFYDQFRWCYAGLIYRGNLIYEQMDSNPTDQTIYIDDVSIRLKSCNFTTFLNGSGIYVGENFTRSGFRGFTFYVIAIDIKKTLSAAGFDVFSSPLQKMQIYPTRTFLHDYSQKHKEITVVTCVEETLRSVSESLYTENEKFIKKTGIGREAAVNLGILTEYYPSVEDRKVLVNAPPSYRDMFGVRKFFDFESRFVNCKNGIRFTPGVPENYKRAIYLAGGCGTFGVGVADNETQAAYLQKLLNENCPELGIAVFNYGYYLLEPGEFKEGEIETIIDFLPTRPGDIVITPGSKDEADDFCDCSEITRPYKYGEIYYDCGHKTRNGHREFADMIFDKLKENNFYENAAEKTVEIAKTPRRDELNLTPEDTAKLSQYIAVLDNIAGLLEIKPDENIGAIVMNCNPFTNGHRYLIETAAAQVKYLIIFVVEEDKSDFPFADRYELVQAATEDLENVFAVPSGNFIISSLTFSEYFNKKEIASMSVNPSNDVRMFGGQLAPHLFVKVRFAGEEPLDPVTRRYNQEMEAILPQYGIKFVEIPRKETDGNVISASRVRELLKTRDFEAIEKLVPEVTLEYLKNMYKL